jgi:hypothetical protein
MANAVGIGVSSVQRTWRALAVTGSGEQFWSDQWQP